MTDIALVCERWTMNLEPPAPEQPWFLDWVLRSPKEVSGHLTAGWLAYQSLRRVYAPHQIKTAREYFGGMGAQAHMIQELFAPEQHTILDYSADAVQHLRRELDFAEPPRVQQADSYDPSSCVPADLIGLDFGDLTVWKTRDGEPHRRLLDRVFIHGPKAVVLTDIAGPRLHLQRERYETLLGEGTCVDYDHYLYALLLRIRDLYGYTLCGGFSHRWSTVMALVPDGAIDVGAMEDVPSHPIGLQIF